MILIMIYDHKIYAHMSDLWIYSIIRRSAVDTPEANNKPQLQQLGEEKKNFWQTDYNFAVFAISLCRPRMRSYIM